MPLPIPDDSHDPDAPARSADATATARLLAALHFAADRHRWQRRKDPDASPYINHPIAVAELLARVGGVTDVDVLVAAVLHDTVEDTETTLEELEVRFGARVRGIVAEVTDDKSLHWEERKRRQVEHAPHASREAKLVKLGDKILNVRDVTHFPPRNWPVARRAQYLTWAAAVIAGCRGTNAALERHFDDLLAEGRALLAALPPDTLPTATGTSIHEPD